ncbi:MAG TPA: YdeI/OmpD-associated family protein [Pseudonocardiaceae bacterium]|jgi:uncharacterized protein YdeI (YjbR/CyaY-like superfamily)|nr:YdeI/OmpD-associated family protein [Pseudonocardiaceae bacterium]
MASELPELVLAAAAGWRSWLADNHADPAGVWLVLAKKGTTEPTSLTYDEALLEALRHGWIDGQVGRRDERTYRQRFTPRRARSPWSQRNVGIVTELIERGEMHPAGLAEVDRARADGRWGAAYAGPAANETPEDLLAALAGNPGAQAMFDRLSSRNRFAVCYRVGQAKRAETRARRIAGFVEMLARGETIYPQK